MSRRAKVTFLLSMGTVLNLLGYLYITGSWKMFFQPSTPKKLSRWDQSVERAGVERAGVERELAEILHRAVNVHNMSPENLTNLVNRLLPGERHVMTGLNAGGIARLATHRDKLAENQTGPDGNQRPQPPAVHDDGKAAPEQESGQEVQKPAAPAKDETAVVAKAREESMQKPPEPHPRGNMLSGVIQAVKNGGKVPPVNPHDFSYQINEPQKCFNADGSEREVFLLVLICTIHKNFENRNAIRQSWGSPTEVEGRKVITMFLLAARSDEKLQRAVLEESEQYHDIIMEDFVDTYKNLTLKTIMGMKWMATFCGHAKYMMKTDDDMYVSYSNLARYLSESPDTGFVTGMVIKGGPIRDPKSKWYMPKELYAEPRYPPFCSGTGYAMSGDVPPEIYATSLATPYLYLEDVYVAICIHKLNIVPVNHKEFHNWRTTYTFCHYKRILTAHMVTPTQMIRYWADQRSNKHKC